MSVGRTLVGRALVACASSLYILGSTWVQLEEAELARGQPACYHGDAAEGGEADQLARSTEHRGEGDGREKQEAGAVALDRGNDEDEREEEHEGGRRPVAERPAHLGTQGRARVDDVMCGFFPTLCVGMGGRGGGHVSRRRDAGYSQRVDDERDSVGPFSWRYKGKLVTDDAFSRTYLRKPDHGTSDLRF